MSLSNFQTTRGPTHLIGRSGRLCFSSVGSIRCVFFLVVGNCLLGFGFFLGVVWLVLVLLGKRVLVGSISLSGDSHKRQKRVVRLYEIVSSATTKRRRHT